MSEKHHSGHSHHHIENTDNENTSTIYIPPELLQPYQPPQQSEPQNTNQPKPIASLNNTSHLPNLKYTGGQNNQQNQNNTQNQQYYNNGTQYQNGVQNPQYYNNQQYQNGVQNPQYYNNQQYQNGVQNPQYYNNQQYQNGVQNPQYYNNQQYQNGVQNPQYYNNQQYQNTGQQAYYTANQPRPQQRNNNQVNRKKSNTKKSKPKQKKQKKKRQNIFGKILWRLISTLLILFLLVFGIYSCTSVGLIKKMNYVETGSRTRDFSALSESYVTSVLLIGTDGRVSEDKGRSDTMILLSMNSHTKEITLTSFMRDCNVYIPNYGWDKLNSAYSYGGAELLMDTIENNFGVLIDDYISVDFISFSNIIDSVGGLVIEVSEEEAREINVILQSEVNELMGDDPLSDLLEAGGKLRLNGKQALSYARIRNVGNSDFDRTERQRNVMSMLLKKLKSFNPAMLQKITQNVMPRVSTNVPTLDMYFLSLKLPLTVGYNTKQIQIPYEGTFYDDYTESGSVLQVDFDANYNVIKSQVFDD